MTEIAIPLFPEPTRPPVPRVLGKDVFNAHLAQRDPDSGLRGWYLYVALPGRVADWPERVWSRQASGRPPVIAERIGALAELGFEPAGEEGFAPESFEPSELWHWAESGGAAPLLFASITVRRITTGEAN